MLHVLFDMRKKRTTCNQDLWADRLSAGTEFRFFFPVGVGVGIGVVFLLLIDFILKIK